MQNKRCEIDLKILCSFVPKTLLRFGKLEMIFKYFLTPILNHTSSLQQKKVEKRNLYDEPLLQLQ